MDYSKLKTELLTDPKALGYAQLIKQGSHARIAALLNAASGPGAASVQVNSVSKNTFLKALASLALTFTSKPAATIAKWSTALQLVLAVDGNIAVNDPNVSSLLSAAVADGLLTQAQVSAIQTRVGSRAEVVLGADTVVRHQDITAALRS